jgi:PAS domain-containing protein
MDVDVTDQRQTECALREANLALDERVRERTADLEDANARLHDEIDERQKAEEAVVESEWHYRRLFETMLLGVVYQDAGGRIIAMNPAAERILGKGPEEFLGGSSVDEEHHTLRENGTPFPGLEHPAMVALRTG